MFKKYNRKAVRDKKRRRLRNKLFGTSERPRLSVYRSSKHIYAQVIDDTVGSTLVAASTLDADIKGEIIGANAEAAKKTGQLVAKKALEKGIKKVVFDRGGYIYHGRIAALAEGAREGGLEF
ncbi:50S ribosomal protein L18 [Metallumcola ferriviriculae]|uniref:Large ribosomal subunit protein uL18 n=1 Tax=Metallumcola ferriviriculae TaxID=3039180 RepID=A0AAU0UGH6_9FIRM|nr:50S ribosomal protein L18 [Desulfitibacteraceae bacterium MK1]